MIEEKGRKIEYQDKIVILHGSKGTVHGFHTNDSRKNHVLAVKCPITGEIIVPDMVMEPLVARLAVGESAEASLNYMLTRAFALSSTSDEVLAQGFDEAMAMQGKVVCISHI